jgi:hypothetical protein
MAGTRIERRTESRTRYVPETFVIRWYARSNRSCRVTRKGPMVGREWNLEAQTPQGPAGACASRFHSPPAARSATPSARSTRPALHYETTVPLIASRRLGVSASRRRTGQSPPAPGTSRVTAIFGCGPGRAVASRLRVVFSAGSTRRPPQRTGPLVPRRVTCFWRRKW